jgi:hypothetical protein
MFHEHISTAETTAVINFQKGSMQRFTFSSWGFFGAVVRESYRSFFLVCHCQVYPLHHVVFCVETYIKIFIMFYWL